MKKSVNLTKVLILENYKNNETLNLRVLHGTLNDFEVFVINSKSEYLIAIRDYKPDIILFDKSLESFNYEEALIVLNASQIEVPFIILSEDMSRNGGLEMLELGVSDYILKDKPENLLFFINKTITKFIFEKEKLALKNLEYEKKYRAFFENSLDGILLTTVDGIIYAANEAACKLFQMTENEICKKGRSGLVDLKDPRLYESLKERERTGRTHSEIYFFRKNGSRFLGEFSSVIIQPDKGIASLIIRDNTEKKHIIDELQQSEERYKSLFKFNPLPTFMFNENDLSLVDVNVIFCKNYGYTRDELLKMSLKDFRHPKEHDKLYQLIEKSKKSKKNSFHSFSKHLKKDNTEILVENNYHRFFIDGIPYIVSISNDITEKVQSHKKLTDITKKLKVAEKIANLGYWELSLNDNTFFCSDYFYEICGLENKNLKPALNGLIDMIHPKDRKRYDKEIKDLLSGHKASELEYRIVLEDGSIKWLYSRSQIVKKSNGQKICVKGIIQDITSKKLVFEELTKSESRYKGLVHSQTTYFIRIGLDGNYSFCNKKFIEEFGWAFKDNDPIGKSSLTDVMKYHHQKLRETAEECITRPNENCQIEIDKRMADGGVKTTLWDMIYLINNGDEGEIQCVGIDISERVKAERENKFQADLLNKIGQGIMATDSNDKLTYWNKGAEEMYMWTQEEVLGKDVFKLLYGIDENHENTLKLLKSGISWSGELNAKLKDGSILPTQITKSPLFDDNNNFVGFIRISSDISNLKKSEIKLKKLNLDLNDYTKELYSANEGLEQFSYIVSHNVRAPIANIIGIVDLLENSSQPEAIQKDLINEIFSNVGRLDLVMQDLNETLNLKNGFPKNLESLKLDALIENIIASNQNLIAKEKVVIKTDFKAINEIHTIKSYLYSTFFNLISNSIKYRKPNVAPIIEIKSEDHDNQVIISFKDNGLGMDIAKNADIIFGFYKRLHNHVEGKGLGLFMVKSQLEMLGGRIKVNSTIGVGTEFIIYLPNDKQS